MTAQPMPDKPDQNAENLAEPIDRIATRLTEVSGELGRFSAQLRARPGQARTETDHRERSDPGARSPDPPGRAERIGTVTRVNLGEPVDTSFAEPTRTPVAQAAGVSPYATARTRSLRWFAGAITLLGAVLLLLEAALHGWVFSLIQVAGGIALGAGLFGFGLWTGQRGTAQPR